MRTCMAVACNKVLRGMIQKEIECKGVHTPVIEKNGSNQSIKAIIKTQKTEVE